MVNIPLLVATRVAEKSQHIVLGQKVEVQLAVSEPATEDHPNTVTPTNNTLLVTGHNLNQDKLDLYFSNEAKCGGGNIADITVKDNKAYITYANSGGNYCNVIATLLLSVSFL